MTDQGGLFFGRIIINAEGKNYTLPYIVSWLRYLNVSVMESGMTLYPDIYVHTDELRGRSQAYQFYDFLGPNCTLLIPSNKNITVYAIGDNANDSLTYILMKNVNASTDDTNVTLVLSNDSRPFTINTTALDGSTIKVYEFEYGFASYRNNSIPIKVRYTTEYKIGNVVHLSNKPESLFDTDIILKYAGIPVNNE
jgi:hypothetical protein